MAKILSVAEAGWIEEARQTLDGGGLVAFPTDTVYGVGANAQNTLAIERIFRAKRRPREKAIPLLIAGVEKLPHVTADIPDSAHLLGERYWPGALTLVLMMHPDLPETISPSGTVGVRVPDHPVALGLLGAYGPLAVTSANLSGMPEARTAIEVQEALGEALDLILDGGRTPGGVASTVVDLTQEPPKLLREGPIPWEEIENMLVAGRRR